MTVTTQQLEILAPTSRFNLNTIADALNKYFPEYNINTPLRIQHFLAQILEESEGFNYNEENLNYSAQGLNKVFPSYFPTIDVATTYAHNPQKIANKIYANRMGNGNEASGDGYLFRGRGFIQLTGKFEYQQISDMLKIDFVSNPDLLETLDNCVLGAIWYWNSHNLNIFADKDDIITITERINGGLNGLSQREARLAQCKTVIV